MPGLQGRPSALDGRTKTWTAEAAAELLERLERGVADPKAPMMTNLRQNLEDATRGAKQLAVELLFLQSLPLAHEVKSLKVKRARVAEAASWLEPPLELPDELYAGHDGPRRHPGPHRRVQLDHLGPPEVAVPLRAARRPAVRPPSFKPAVKDPLAFHRLVSRDPG